MEAFTPAQLNRMKVAELRNELEKRGLNIVGTKPKLIERLKKALKAESQGEVLEDSNASSSGVDAMDTSGVQDVSASTVNTELYQSCLSSQLDASTHQDISASETISEVTAGAAESVSITAAVEAQSAEPLGEVLAATGTATAVAEAVHDASKEVVGGWERKRKLDEANDAVQPNQSGAGGDGQQKPTEPADTKLPEHQNNSVPKIVEEVIPPPKKAPVLYPSSPRPPDEECTTEPSVSGENGDATAAVEDDVIDAEVAAVTGLDEQEGEEVSGEPKAKRDRRDRGLKRNKQQVQTQRRLALPGEYVDEMDDDEMPEDYTGPRRLRENALADDVEEYDQGDDTADDIDQLAVILDPYTSDLNIKINAINHVVVESISTEGFAFMWGGARGNYAFSKGKIAFQVKILEHIEAPSLPSEERYPHLCRVGWSEDLTSLQLGIDKGSYGYDGASMKAKEGRFEKFGEEFGIGDVITACCDFDLGEIRYYKNETALGISYHIVPDIALGVDKPAYRPLFPHVCVKNCKVQCNFGQEDWSSLPAGYTFVNEIALDDRHLGPPAPSTKKDCTVILLCGLPYCGKTTYAQQYLMDNIDDRYNLLSTDVVLERMRDEGFERHKNTQGRWDVLLGMSAKCVTRLIALASRRARNYIIDQTNCTAQARRRKMTLFKDFRRKALVIVPKEEEYIQRQKNATQGERKTMPPDAILEMKSDFSLPTIDDGLYDEIEFQELQRVDAEALVKEYHEEGRAYRPPPTQRREGEGSDDERPARGSPEDKHERMLDEQRKMKEREEEEKEKREKRESRWNRDSRDQQPQLQHNRGGHQGGGGGWDNRGRARWRGGGGGGNYNQQRGGYAGGYQQHGYNQGYNYNQGYYPQQQQWGYNYSNPYYGQQGYYQQQGGYNQGYAGFGGQQHGRAGFGGQQRGYGGQNQNYQSRGGQRGGRWR